MNSALSPDLFVLRELDGTLLIGRRSLFLRMPRNAAASEAEVARRLTRRRERHTILDGLDTYRGRWGLDVMSPWMARSRSVERVVEGLARGQLSAFVLPSIDIAATVGADLDRARDAIRLVTPARLPGRAGVKARDAALPHPAIMSLDQRLAVILNEAEALLPQATRFRYSLVFAPVMFTKTVAVLTFWAGSDAAAATRILAALLGSMGLSWTAGFGDTTAEILDLLDAARGAATVAHVAQAASRLARLLDRVGEVDVSRIIQIVPDKIRGGAPVKEAYVYPPMRSIEPRLQERPRRDDTPPEPRSILPVASSSPSAQVQALISAARSGTPFCEECARAAAAVA